MSVAGCLWRRLDACELRPNCVLELVIGAQNVQPQERGTVPVRSRTFQVADSPCRDGDTCRSPDRARSSRLRRRGCRVHNALDQTGDRARVVVLAREHALPRPTCVREHPRNRQGQVLRTPCGRPSRSLPDPDPVGHAGAVRYLKGASRQQRGRCGSAPVGAGPTTTPFGDSETLRALATFHRDSTPRGRHRGPSTYANNIRRWNRRRVPPTKTPPNRR
jgi:hypothetical protein